MAGAVKDSATDADTVVDTVRTTTGAVLRGAAGAAPGRPGGSSTR